MVIIPGSADLHFTDEDLADQRLLEVDAALSGEYEPGPDAPEVAFLDTTMRLSRTVANFVRSDADVVLIMGPRREGKTAGGVARLLRVAAEYPAAWPIRVAVVRDTWRNLERSLLATLREGHALGWWDAEIRESGTEVVLNGGQVHLFLFGMDNPKDASKFQSFECGIAWLEEPAAAADLSSGIPIDVFAMALTSTSQRDMPSSIQITFNPPDEDHWPLWHGTPVLTPTGWVKIGDLRPGDRVIAADGMATEVTGVYPRGVQPLYRVRFSDRTSILATGCHPWGVTTKWDRSGKAKRGGRTSVRVVTTDQIRTRLNAHARRKQVRWAIPLVKPIQFPRRPVPIDPYTLGALLGDGGMTTGEVKLCSADPELIEHVRHQLPPGVYLRHLYPARPKNPYDYVFLSEGGRGTPNPINRAIKALGLAGHAARTKFIPEVYLWNTPEVRLAMLQGLLDTDGHASPDGNSVSFASISERLIEGVEFLVRSLGGITRRRAKGPVGPRRPNELYVRGIVLPEGMKPFRLSRKNGRLISKSMRHRARRYIVGCDPCGEGEAVCISVAHPDRLFVCDQFIVTHNTLELVDHLQELGHPEMRVEMFSIPPGENRHIKAGYREKMRIGLEQANRPDLIRRLVEGQIGTIIVGEPVTPEFSDLHIAKAPIQIRLAWPVIRGWDAWLSPACVWAQVMPSGHINILGCVQGVNIGIEELLEEQVLPWERKFGLRPGSAGKPFGPGARRGATFRDIGDPSMYARDQSSSERSARWSLEKILNTTLEKAPVAWPARRDSIKAVLTRMFGGRPMLQIDPEEGKLLIHCLRGRWRYAKYPSGRISDEPVKDMSSHVTDALAYLCAVLYPAHEMVRAAVRAVPERVARYQPRSWEGR